MFGLVLRSFWLVFLAEMGDKTQLSTLALASSADGKFSHPRLAVFAGSAAALCATSALAALCGGWLAEKIDPKWVRAASGALFIVFGVVALRSAFVQGGVQ